MQEEVAVAAVEETCTTAPVEQCGEELVRREEEREEEQCDTVTEEKCTESEQEEGCGEEKCEEVCRPVSEEKCEASYEVTTKEECSYATVMDEKCSRGYSVAYTQRCTPSLHCSLLGLSCRRVDRCRQVPSLPRPLTCHRVPRQVGPACRQVPVKRPTKVCRQVERRQCEEVCIPGTPCSLPTNTCTPVERERCKQVQVVVPVEVQEVVCRTKKVETCTKQAVSRPKLVNKRVCRELTDQEILDGKQGGDQLTSYVDLDNLG